MKRLWFGFLIMFIVSFAILGWVGTRIYQEAPPIPKQVLVDGEIFISKSDIENGQGVWRSMGGMEVGSVWGHGGYLAPDWTADYLHQEAVFILNYWSAAEFNKKYDELDSEHKGQLVARLTELVKTNTYDPSSGIITLSPVRRLAFEKIVSGYEKVFMEGHEAYSIPKGAVRSKDRVFALTSFYFWSSWAASTLRPGEDITYTHNWPHEPLVGNRLSGESQIWTGVSILVLLAGIGAMAFWYASRRETLHPDISTEVDPLGTWKCTPSQLAVKKYIFTIAALFMFQLTMGVITAHYGVEGLAFYGVQISDYLPYSITRTWHIQGGLFWIATAWLACGIFIAPLVNGGYEPKYQRALVNILFGALLLVVVGSFVGQWLSVQNKIESDTVAFYLGHQGYEYVDLGRVWQIALFVGLLLWLFIVLRAILPRLKFLGEKRQIIYIFLMSAVAIGLFYGAGLTWGEHSNLSIVNYWRWWVVHLWVEGFFEVFATTVIAYVFVELKLIHPKFAGEAALLSAIIFLSGGIVGTLHHLYFAGTPTSALAFGSAFSALEVVPLVLVSYGAVEDFRQTKRRVWMSQYKWAIYFFLAVAFWNLVGAGLFGFMINPPTALYFMQGLNTTATHGHSALFGVYGMLGLGLVLLCLRLYNPSAMWNEKALKYSFWFLNIGLFLMCVGSLLPIGLFQTFASVKYGYWFARTPEFLNSPHLTVFKWVRAPSDTLFALGGFIFVVFVFKNLLSGRVKQ